MSDLLLKFENDEENFFNVKPYLEIGKFQELKDENLFKNVKAYFDSIEWPNQLKSNLAHYD